MDWESQISLDDDKQSTLKSHKIGDGRNAQAYRSVKVSALPLCSRAFVVFCVSQVGIIHR